MPLYPKYMKSINEINVAMLFMAISFQKFYDNIDKK